MFADKLARQLSRFRISLQRLECPSTRRAGALTLPCRPGEPPVEPSQTRTDRIVADSDSTIQFKSQLLMSRDYKVAARARREVARDGGFQVDFRPHVERQVIARRAASILPLPLSIVRFVILGVGGM